MTNIISLNEPNEGDFLWRYIRPEWVQDFLNGQLYFSQLLDFTDRHEAIQPLHSVLRKFLTVHANRKFDLQTPLNEQDVETVPGTFLMWISLYDLKKKLTNIGLVRDDSQVQDILLKYLSEPQLLHKPHIEMLTGFYANCWFVGKYEESALMWTSYSKPGGIAVRIKFSEFKEHLTKYFSSEKFDGIENVYSGAINYVNHDADWEEWNNKINNGIPLCFFKQHYYSQECEYRVVIERKASMGDSEFNRKHCLLRNLENYDIILHPSSWYDELLEIQGLIPDSKRIHISLSSLSFDKDSLI